MNPKISMIQKATLKVTNRVVTGEAMVINTITATEMKASPTLVKSSCLQNPKSKMLDDEHIEERIGS